MFPFYWVGAAFAAGFLTASMLVFALFAKLLSVAEGARGSIVPGLVEGFRDWARDGATMARRIVSSPSSDAGPTIMDAASGAVPTERVHGHVA